MAADDFASMEIHISYKAKIMAVDDVVPCVARSSAVMALVYVARNHPGVALYTSKSHQMETFSAVLALFEGNPPIIGEFPSQRSVTRSLDVFFDVRLRKRLSKQSICWWFETPWSSLWRHHNEDKSCSEVLSLTWLTLVPALKSDYILYKVWNEIF